MSGPQLATATLAFKDAAVARLALSRSQADSVSTVLIELASTLENAPPDDRQRLMEGARDKLRVTLGVKGFADFQRTQEEWFHRQQLQ
jgi:hypothetical protein